MAANRKMLGFPTYWEFSAERERERNLADLKDQIEKLIGFARSCAGLSSACRGARKSGGGIDWSKVPDKLRREFKSGEICKVRGQKDNRSPELFAAITRWIDSRAVKKQARGICPRIK
jgi:hypothetical protein